MTPQEEVDQLKLESEAAQGHMLEAREGYDEIQIGRELVIAAYHIARQLALLRKELDYIGEHLPMAGRGA